MIQWSEVTGQWRKKSPGKRKIERKPRDTGRNQSHLKRNTFSILFSRSMTFSSSYLTVDGSGIQDLLNTRGTKTRGLRGFCAQQGIVEESVGLKRGNLVQLFFENSNWHPTAIEKFDLPSHPRRPSELFYWAVAGVGRNLQQKSTWYGTWL